MTSQVEAILTLGAAIVKTVPGTGNVYTQLMYARTEVEFNALWQVQLGGVNRVAAWMLTSDRETRKRGASRGFILETIPLQLYGYLDVQQAKGSESAFNALTEKVADALDSQFKLGDINNTTSLIASQDPAQIVYRRYAKFGEVLCHVARIDVAITVQRQFPI